MCVFYRLDKDKRVKRVKDRNGWKGEMGKLVNWYWLRENGWDIYEKVRDKSFEGRHILICMAHTCIHNRAIQ